MRRFDAGRLEKPKQHIRPRQPLGDGVCRRHAFEVANFEATKATTAEPPYDLRFVSEAAARQKPRRA